MDFIWIKVKGMGELVVCWPPDSDGVSSQGLCGEVGTMIW